MTKYTMSLTAEQEEQLDRLKSGLGCTTRAEVFRRSLNLAVLVTEEIAKGGSLAIEKDGKVIKGIRLV